MSGRLSLVGTPIGNLGDITVRAIERLGEVDRIYAEDTRRTRVLLSHLGIEGKRLLSLHAHSSERTIAAALEILSGGQNVALVTDAGMPTVSDPGSLLVRRAREAGIDIDVLPGPSAVTTAVAISGMVDGPFSFFGFLPRKGRKRKTSLEQVAQSPIPVVLFESPHRIAATLRDLCEACGRERQVAVCRELTKKFEETRRGPLSSFTESEAERNWQGEITVVVDHAPEGTPAGQDDQFDADERAAALIAQGTSVKEAASQVSRELLRRGEKASRRDVYQRILSLGLAGRDERQ